MSVRWLMRALVLVASPAIDRDMVVGDLDEEWEERIRPSLGRVAAELWYARESLSLVFGLLRDRLRARWEREPQPRGSARPEGLRPASMRARHRLNGAPVHERGWRNGWATDFRHTVQGLARQPGFTITALLTLGLGVGATVVMFTLVHAAYLLPLPYPDADRLVKVFTGYENSLEGRNPISPLTWQDAENRRDLVDATEVWERRSYHLRDDSGTVRRVEGARVSAGLFGLMGATPAVGRLFLQAEATPGADGAVILSHVMWTQSFGGDSAVLGTTLVLDGGGYEVVGVLEPGFELIRGAELWIPLALGSEWYEPGRRGWEFLETVARLDEGVTPAIAAAGLTDQLVQEAPDRVANVGQRVNVIPLREHLVGDTGAVLLVLLAAVTLVLLIGCANVMNLLLARAESRRHEFALRRALGSGARRLGRLVVLETFLLTAAAGALGVVGAVAVTRAIAASPPANVAALGELAVGWPVVLFAVAVSAGTALLFGMAPVASALTSAPSEVLRESTGRAGGSAYGARIRSGLVVMEVALAVVLVFGVGVTAESFRRLTTMVTGFEADGKLAVKLETPVEGYGGVERGEVYRRIFDRVRALPSVSQAALTYALPLTGVVWSASFDLVEPDPSVADAALGGNMRPVSPGYFRTMGIPLLSGRVLNATDEPGAPPVVVVDEAVARRAWPGRSPLGERIELEVFLGDMQEATVVGVVGNVRDRDLATPGAGHVYFSAWQSPQREMILVAASTGDLLSLAPQIGAVVAEVDARIPVYDVRPLSSLVDATLASPRLGLLLMSTFGAVALLLAAVGVYGVVSYTVVLRTREISTRIALGATPGKVLAMVLRRVTLLWLAGGVAGSIVALAAASIAEGLLFEMDRGNPMILVAAVLGLGLVAVASTTAPARRAARLDGIEVLRRG